MSMPFNILPTNHEDTATQIEFSANQNQRDEAVLSCEKFENKT